MFWDREIFNEVILRCGTKTVRLNEIAKLLDHGLNKVFLHMQVEKFTRTVKDTQKSVSD